MFKIPIQCNQHTKTEVFVESTFIPSVSNLQSEFETVVSQTGNMVIYKDENFSGKIVTSIDVGVMLFVQSELENNSKISLISCATSPGPMSGLGKVDKYFQNYKIICFTKWTLVTALCLDNSE